MVLSVKFHRLRSAVNVGFARDFDRKAEQLASRLLRGSKTRDTHKVFQLAGLGDVGRCGCRARRGVSVFITLEVGVVDYLVRGRVVKPVVKQLAHLAQVHPTHSTRRDA